MSTVGPIQVDILTSVAEDGNGVIPHPGRTHARGEIDLTVRTETEAPWEWNDPVGKKGHSSFVKTSG